MKRITTTLIALIAGVLSFANQQINNDDVLLTDLAVFQPKYIGQQVLHNFPDFKSDEYLMLNTFDADYTVNENGQLHGQFVAQRYYAGYEGIGTYKERFVVNYANGIVQGEASYELSFSNANFWDHDYKCSVYSTQERIEATYFYGECEYVKYENDFYTPYMEAEAMAIEIEEDFPVKVSTDYFLIVAEYEFRTEEDRPTISLQSNDASVVYID